MFPDETLKQAVSDVFVSRGWKMVESGEGERERVREGGRKRCINREGEEVVTVH